jgi:hypothetical protein
MMMTFKLDNSSSSKSKKTSNNSTPNNSKSTKNMTKGLMSIKTVLFTLFLMGSVLALQEALTFKEEKNKTIHYFSDTETLFKCEGGFYSAGQILAIKDKELD